jgi:hypothetical protein
MLVNFRFVHHLAYEQSLVEQVFVHCLGGNSCILGIIVLEKCVAFAFSRLKIVC